MFIKYIIGLATALLLISNLLAQPCYRGISTNPDAPVNPQCPTLVNTFDWRTEMLPVSGNVPTPPGSPPITELLSPFWEDESPSNWFLAKPSYSTYHDFEVDEGWEILYLDMEYRLTKNYVYFMLYNKYESFIRVFTTQSTLSSPNNTTAIELKFPLGTSVTALLSPFLGRSQPLDENSLDKIEMTNVYYSNSFRFTYFDIPVEYDPCTCQSNNPSLGFNFALVNEQELDLYSRYTDVEQSLASIVKIDADSRTAPDEFLAGIDDGVAGTSTFKTWDQLVAYHGRLSSEVSALKKEYNRIQAFDKVLSLALKAGGGKILSAFKLIKTNLEVDGDTVSIKGKDAAELFLGSLNLFGAGVKKRLESANSQLTNLGSSTLTLGEKVTRGTLTGEYSSGGPQFALPGSTTDCTDPDNYPVYNEVLGRMALLRKPTVTVQPYGADLPGNPPLSAAQLSLDQESIHYVFNPAAEIDEDATEINALLRIYDFGGDISSSPNLTPINDDPIGFVSPLLPLGCISDYVAQIEFPLTPIPHTQLPLDLQVELVLLVAYTFENGYQAIQQYTYPVTFDVQPIQTVDFLAPVPGFTPNYPTDLILEATDYIEDEMIFAYRQISIEGDQRLANYIYTPEEILLPEGTIIAGDTTAGAAIFVEMAAPEILVRDADLLTNPPEASGGEIWLHNREYVRDCDPIPPSTEDLAIFCGSSEYKANIAQSLQETDTEGEIPLPSGEKAQEEEAPQISLAISVSPNPVGSYASILLELPADESVTMTMLDIMGRPVETLFRGRWLTAGNHYFDLKGEQLVPGQYILRVETSQEIATFRFVR